MELLKYIQIVRRWLWLIVLLTVICGVLGFIINGLRPATYEARAVVSIGRFIDARNPDQADIRVGIDLAQTYEQLVHMDQVLQSTIDELNLALDTDDLDELVHTRILEGTSLLVIEVTYPDAVLVADIANSLSKQLIFQSPSNLTPSQQAQIDFASSQINALTAQVEDMRLELDRISSQTADTATGVTRQSLVEQRNTLTDQIIQASATIAQFADTISTLQQNTNALDVVEAAKIPDEPSNLSHPFAILLGAAIGAALALGGVVIYEYLDETIRTSEDAVHLLGLPLLGTISQIGKPSDKYQDHLIINLPPTSPAGNSYRVIRTNLLYSAGHSSTRIYMICSPGPSEGKSLTAANLAISMASADLQVLLIDADLHMPKVHEIFDLDNRFGLATLLQTDLYVQDTKLAGNYIQVDSGSVLDCIQYSSIPKLRFITSGFSPPNPSELLGSTKFYDWVEYFRSALDIDIIIVDTPPSLVVPDSRILAANIGAEVVLVIDCVSTRYEEALQAKQQFEQLGVKIRGLVANRISSSDQRYENYASNAFRQQQLLVAETALLAEVTVATVAEEDEKVRTQKDEVETIKNIYNLAFHTTGKKSEVVSMFYRLREGIFAIASEKGEIREVPRKSYISYRHSRNFCQVQLMAKGLKLHLDVPASELEDAREFARDVSGSSRWGTGDTEVRVNHMADVDYALDLIEQAYLLTT